MKLNCYMHVCTCWFTSSTMSLPDALVHKEGSYSGDVAVTPQDITGSIYFLVNQMVKYSGVLTGWEFTASVAGNIRLQVQVYR